jgi:hypothetical protein
MPQPRTADPYRDLDVIDARAPRLTQATVGALALAGAATGAWPAFALAAAVVTAGLLLGRRWCLPCRFYFDVVQPLLGEGPVEDARPPRFANQLGAVFLWSAAALGVVGLVPAARAVGLLVAGLALLAAATGFCAGCVAYRVAFRLRGVRARSIDRLDLAELGGQAGREAVVQFTHPLCSDCVDLSRRLAAAGTPLVLVDVSRRPDLARKYGVAVVPLAVAVGPDGRVSRRVP